MEEELNNLQEIFFKNASDFLKWVKTNGDYGNPALTFGFNR